MLADKQVHNEVEGRVDRLVEEVEELASKVAELLQDLLPTIVAQEGDHISNQGINKSRNDNAADNIHEDVGNVNVSNGQSGCSYKDFVACKSKDFNGKGSAIAYTCWVDKMEAVQDISGCEVNHKVKYASSSLTSKALTWWNNQGHTMVRVGHATYTDQFHELARLVPHLVTPKTKRIEMYIYGLALKIHEIVAATKPPIIQNAILKAGVLTDEAVRSGSLRKSGEKRGDGGELIKEGNFKGDNKRTRTGKGTLPRIAGRGQDGGNNPNQALTIEGGQGRGNNGNLARGRAFVMGAEEAR
ncbi:hypothetical protein Tco_0436808 [Tanacetum coccineum]